MSDRTQSFGMPSSGSRMTQVSEKAKDAAATAREQLGFGTQAVKNFVTEKPALALGVALGMGAILGWLIKRR